MLSDIHTIAYTGPMFDEYDKYLEGASEIGKGLPDVDSWIDKLTVTFSGSADVDPLDAEMSGHIQDYVTKRSGKVADVLSQSWDIVARQHIIMEAMKNAIQILQQKLLRSQDAAIHSQEQVIKAQQQLLAKQSVEMEQIGVTVQNSVSETLKAEVKSTYASVIDSSGTGISTAKLKQVHRDLRDEEDRSCNFMVFGLKESADESVEGNVELLLAEIDEKPKCSEVSRIGKKADSVTRPIRVTVSSSSVVSHILRKASGLRESDRYQGVFLGPDRSKSERLERRKLVEDLKERRNAEPSSKFVIRKGEVVSADE